MNRIVNIEEYSQRVQKKGKELLAKAALDGIKHYRGKGKVISTLTTGNIKIEITDQDLEDSVDEEMAGMIDFGINRIRSSQDNPKTEGNPNGVGFVLSKVQLNESKKD